MCNTVVLHSGHKKKILVIFSCKNPQNALEPLLQIVALFFKDIDSKIQRIKRKLCLYFISFLISYRILKSLFFSYFYSIWSSNRKRLHYKIVIVRLVKVLEDKEKDIRCKDPKELEDWAFVEEVTSIRHTFYSLLFLFSILNVEYVIEFYG